MRNKKNSLGWISGIYIIVMVVSLGILVFFLAIAPNPFTKDPDLKEKSDNFKTIFSTLITLIFGTASKSFHKALVLAPYNFDEDELKKNVRQKSRNTTVEIFIDLMSGLAIFLYILKYFNTPNIYVIIIGVLIGLVLTILWFWAFKIKIKD